MIRILTGALAELAIYRFADGYGDGSDWIMDENTFGDGHYGFSYDTGAGRCNDQSNRLTVTVKEMYE